MKRTMGFALTLVLVASASGQLDNGLPGPQPLDAGALALNRQLLSGIMDHNQEVRDGRAGRASAGVLVYRRNPAVTARVKQQYLARAERAYGPQIAKGLGTLFATNDFVAMWTKAAAEDGMRPNDLGDSLAEYWGTSWAIANDRSTATPAQIRAIRFQIGPIVARNPSIRRMSDAQKQAFSETLMLNALVKVIGADAARKKGDPGTLDKLRSATRTTFHQEFGVDLNAVRLTNRGFERA